VGKLVQPPILHPRSIAADQVIVPVDSKHFATECQHRTLTASPAEPPRSVIEVLVESRGRLSVRSGSSARSSAT
jgi:hypothetical protein